MAKGTKLPAKTWREFERIAKKHMFFETLEERKSDSLDFKDVAVWCVAAALEEAYELGRRDALAEKGGTR
jgi:hypothetical protein